MREQRNLLLAKVGVERSNRFTRSSFPQEFKGLKAYLRAFFAYTATEMVTCKHCVSMK